MICCKECNKELESDNIALCKKFFGTKTTEFYCYDCLAVQNSCKVEKLMEIVMNYRKMGCMMFTPLQQ